MAEAEEMLELEAPSLSSKVTVCSKPLVVLVPNFLSHSSCSALLQMCKRVDLKDVSMMDPEDRHAPWSDPERRLLASIDSAIGELAGQPPHAEEPPLLPMVAHPAKEDEQRGGGERPPSSFPSGLHIDTNGGVPRRFVAAILYLTSPSGGQTAFPLADVPAARGGGEQDLPVALVQAADEGAVEAGRWLAENGVLHTRGAKLDEEVSKVDQVMAAAESGAGLAALAKTGSLVLFWCRRGDGNVCTRSWHSGMRVRPDGEAKWILRKFKTMPSAVWDGDQACIASYVKATRRPHLPAKPRVSREGVATFEANPYTEDGRELTGCIVWDGGESLAKFLAWRHDSESFAGKAVVELGAGTGLVGLTLAKLGARVTLTDCEPEVLALLERNIKANTLSGIASVHRLDFGDASTYMPAESRADLVVASDVLYHSTRGPDLASVIDAHLSEAHGSSAFFAYTCRAEAPLEHFMASLLAKGFVVERLEDAAGLAVAGVRGTPSEVYGDSYFRALPEDGVVQAIEESASSERFSAGNEPAPGGGGVQILRLTRSVPN